MLHSNAGELHQLFSTFNRVWGAGGAASLSLKTVDGKVSATLEVQLGPPADLRPGAPVAQQQAAGGVNQQLGHQHRRRQRGPGRQARDAARREAWRKRRQEAQPPLPVLQPQPPPPPPPPPAPSPRRLVTVVKEKTNRSSFCQLDGEASDCEEATEPTTTKTPPSTTSPIPTPATPSAVHGFSGKPYRGRPLMPPEDGTTAKCGYRCGYQDRCRCDILS